jgi:pimeloyl-ACP methyl ester carboxylesterase
LSRVRRAVWALGVASVLALGGGIAVEHVGAAALIYAPNAGHPLDPPDDPPPPPPEGGLTTRALRIPVGPPDASLSLVIVDKALHGPAPRGTVFVLHGIRDHKEAMLGWARSLAQAGYRAVLVDARGHGRSTGQFLTYGVVESRDLSQVLVALSAQGLVAGRVGVMGVSYGAATAIEWASVEPRVAAVVAVAPFASLRQVIPGYVRHFSPVVGGLVPGFLIDRAVARAGRTAGFDPDAASPLSAISRTRARVLLIHGGADDRISPRQSEAIHEQAPDHSEVLILPGETHATITDDRSGVLWMRAQAWLDEGLRSPLPGGSSPSGPSPARAPHD